MMVIHRTSSEQRQETAQDGGVQDDGENQRPREKQSEETVPAYYIYKNRRSADTATDVIM